MDYREKIKVVAANTFGVELDKITDDLAVGGIEEWDSVGNLTLFR